MKSLKRTILILLACFIFPTAFAGSSDNLVRLATTTSTENSGLLSVLIPAYEKQSGNKVHVIAVGTGKALRMGRDGDVDVVLVHAPKSEKKFVDSGYGVKRYPVMHNDFVIVGPKSDPAKLKEVASINQAFSNLARSRQIFVSRGDNSGTHKKERSVWGKAGVNPEGPWYREAGQGMGKVLQIAGELDAYTLTDRGTWIAYREKSPLTIVYESDQSLLNPYSIIAVNPEKHDINHKGANSLIQWITSTEGKNLIAGYRLQGEQLFFPAIDNQIRMTSDH
ncbi:MAG TPA: substrate-binding domain-containing protein [Gammaproteobacteria bacterium]|jgi:tungstate transport system substrate-binding protein